MDELSYFNVFFSSIEEVNPMSDVDKQLCYEYFEVKKFTKNTIIECQVPLKIES